MFGNLKKGEILKTSNIIGVRPLSGIPIWNKKTILNKKLKKNKLSGSIIKLNDLK